MAVHARQQNEMVIDTVALFGAPVCWRNHCDESGDLALHLPATVLDDATPGCFAHCACAFVIIFFGF